MEPEEEIHAPKVRIGVLSRSTSTSTTSAQAGVEMMVGSLEVSGALQSLTKLMSMGRVSLV